MKTIVTSKKTNKILFEGELDSIEIRDGEINLNIDISKQILFYTKDVSIVVE